MAGFLRDLKEEIIRRSGENTGSINTLYIGGGTPSVLPLVVLEDIVHSLPGGPYDEFTIEVNPEDIVTGGLPYAEGLRFLGVNRISMGVQSFSDRILRWMNRRHTAARAEEAFRILREAGFGNISLDIITGISILDDETLSDTLQKLTALRPEHISAYQLSLEEGSVLEGYVEAGLYEEASEDSCERQYAMVCKALSEAGYRHYEVSSWARPGFEAMHNSAYWRREPYIGFGPGAHSFDGTLRKWNSHELSGWKEDSETLSEEDARVERIMLSLRTSDGIPLGQLPEEAALRFLAEGSLVREGERVRIPEDKFFVSDDIIRQLI